MKPPNTKRQVTIQKNKMIRGMIKSVTQHSYFEEKPNK
jgi:ribosomal protein L30/L7E